MLPNENFLDKGTEFWTNIQFISERSGYSGRATKKNPELLMKRYSTADILFSFGKIKKKKQKEDKKWQTGLEELDTLHLLKKDGTLTSLGTSILEYLNYRAEKIEDFVKNSLMNKETAKYHFERLYDELEPECNLPKNKQKGEKKHHSYFTCIINMITENELFEEGFDDNPKGLTLITRDEKPFKILSRRMDGAYPSKINPHAIWEVKEYYSTTTFGSRVADAVYESLLDGYEIHELENTISELVSHHEEVADTYKEDGRIKHYLLIDGYDTWYGKGRSYLCRIFDMLHRGFIDEVLFGEEVLERWPEIVRSWK